MAKKKGTKRKIMIKKMVIHKKLKIEENESLKTGGAPEG